MLCEEIIDGLNYDERHLKIKGWSNKPQLLNSTNTNNPPSSAGLLSRSGFSFSSTWIRAVPSIALIQTRDTFRHVAAAMIHFFYIRSLRAQHSSSRATHQLLFLPSLRSAAHCFECRCAHAVISTHRLLTVCFNDRDVSLRSVDQSGKRARHIVTII